MAHNAPRSLLMRGAGAEPSAWPRGIWMIRPQDGHVGRLSLGPHYAPLPVCDERRMLLSLAQASGRTGGGGGEDYHDWFARDSNSSFSGPSSGGRGPVAGAGADPKPGLVDRLQQRAHHDMDHALFCPQYYCDYAVAPRFTELGSDYADQPAGEQLRLLRLLGIACEQAARMPQTGGVNTIKEYFPGCSVLPPEECGR